MKKLLSIAIMITILILPACNIEDTSKRPLSQTEIWDCHKEVDWNKAKMRNELLGKWKWIYSESYWAPEEGRNTENENMTIEFLKDSTLRVKINGELEKTTSWVIKKKDTDSYELEMDTTVSQLYGIILICDDIAKFWNSYIDGNDNYFRKTGDRNNL